MNTKGDKNKEEIKRIFVALFNSAHGKICVDVLEKTLNNDIDFNNPNINYFRAGQKSIIDYIKKNAKL